MTLRQVLTICIAISQQCWVAKAGASANYSVQLLADIAPAGWSAENWAAAADTMIGKTQAHILSDLIENLGITLQVTEEHIRTSIDTDRAALGLPPLPPYAEDPSSLRMLWKSEPHEEKEEDLTHYLPDAWREENFEAHLKGDLSRLPKETRERVRLRIKQRKAAEDANPNKGYLESLPENVLENISETAHQQACAVVGIAPGVRIFKRSLAPVVRIISLQNYDDWGFILYQMPGIDEEIWDKFLDTVSDVIDIHLEDNGFWGSGLELVKDRCLLQVAGEELSPEADVSEVIQHYDSLRGYDLIPPGLDIQIVLMADEESVNSVLNPASDVFPFVWAVDANYNHKKQEKYPAGYDGRFKVHQAALIHSLYVAMGSHSMTPVELWKMLQREAPINIDSDIDSDINSDIGSVHDEL